MQVGFIGLGLMGRAMARNLARAGHDVQAWNRSKGAPIDGVQAVGSPAEAVQADVVLTMLADDPAIRDVILVPNLFAHAPQGVVHVVTSTISVDLADELSRHHAEAGSDYLSAPVFGRPDVAEAAQLNIVAAGKSDVLSRVQPLFDAIGKKTWIIGHEPRQANAAKIAGNMMIAMAIEAMAEAAELTGRHGIAPTMFFELILGTLFGGRAYENYSSKIVKSDFEPGFRMKLGLKDLTLATAAAQHVGRTLPMLDAVRGQMAEAVEAGFGDQDWSAVAKFIRRDE